MRFSKIYDILMSDIEYHEVIEFLKDNIDKSKKIIDVGCGSGNILIRLSLSGYDITGYDIDPEMVKAAHEKIMALNLGATVKAHDINIPFKDRCDVVISMFDVINYFIDPKQTFKNIYDSINTSGFFIFDIYKHEYLKDIAGYHEIETEPIDYQLHTEVSSNIMTHTIIACNEEMNITQYVYELNYYLDLLKETGFKKIEVKHLFDDRKHYLIAYK